MINLMKFQSLTIRARLLWLTLGLAIPLVLIGFFNLWNFWQISRRQLDQSLEQQARLAARAFEQRILAHRQILETISALATSGENSFTLQEYLDSIVKTRPDWLDLQIVDAGGNVVLAQKNKPPNLAADSTKRIKDEAERENSFVVSTEESADRKTSLLSLALPTGNRNFIVARINGASVNDVFERLNLPDDDLIAVFDKNNRLLYRNRALPEQVSLDAGETPLFTALRDRREGVIEVESPYDKVQRVYGLARVGATDSIVAVGIPSQKLYEQARRQFERQILFGSFIAALAIAAAFLIARSITRPMRGLTRAARLFGAGDLTARAEVAHGGSIGELGTTFNQMAEKIAQREKELKALDRLKSEFVSSVSHELRTPLTTIKTLTRILQSDKLTGEEREDYLQTIAAECDRQIEFVQTLLDLSRIESGAYRVSLEAVDVVKLLWDCVEAQSRTAVTRRLRLHFSPPREDGLMASTDAGALRRIVLSLLENAMKYTPEGGAIEISARRESERIVIEIADNGCGIAAEDLPRIFERFFRGRPLAIQNNSASENVRDEDCPPDNETSGTGLGLYLVSGLVKQIGGEIKAESPIEKTGRGTRFILTLPISEK